MKFKLVQQDIHNRFQSPLNPLIIDCINIYLFKSLDNWKSAEELDDYITNTWMKGKNQYLVLNLVRLLDLNNKI